MEIEVLTYSIAGVLGYIDSERHAANFRHIARMHNVSHVIVRLRDLFALDFEGRVMLQEALEHLLSAGKQVYVSSASTAVAEQIANALHGPHGTIRTFPKTSIALTFIRDENKSA